MVAFCTHCGFLATQKCYVVKNDTILKCGEEELQADKVHKVLQEVGLMSKDKTNTIPGDTNTNKVESKLL